MTTLTTAAAAAASAPHPIHPRPAFPSDDRLVFTVAEAGELLGISRAFATVYSPLLHHRPTPNAVPRSAAVYSTDSIALPRSSIRPSKLAGIA